MIILALLLANVVACLVIWWVAITFFLVRDPPDTACAMLLQFGLAVLAACALASALASLQPAYELDPVDVGLRAGGAVVAGWLYDARFGLHRQWRALQAWLVGLPHRTAARLEHVRRLWRQWRMHR